MEVKIEKGSIEYLNACEEALQNSELGKRYFSNENSAANAVKEGLGQGNLFIAKVNNDCAGFVWYIPNGAFHSFPYIHIIAVKEAYRGNGIGKKLLNFIEEIIDKDKIFLVVADFNPNAKRFYEKNGYCQVGKIPNLYRNGITEYLMIKVRSGN